MRNLLRAGALGCALLSTTCLTAPALAQIASAPPPPFETVDENGVDLVTGGFNFSIIEGSIGDANGGVSLDRSWAGDAGWVTRWSGGAYRRTENGASVYKVEFGPVSDTFNISGTTFTSQKGNGATLTDLGNGQLRYVASDGTEVIFQTYFDPTYRLRGYACRPDDANGCSIPVSIRRPDGMRFTIAWDFHDRCNVLNPDGQCAVGVSYYRFRGVTSSANYSFTMSYASNTPGSAAPPPAWYQRNSAQFTNLATPPASLPTVAYTYPSSSSLEVTDTGNRTWRFAYDSGGRLNAIRRPGSSSDNIAVGYGANGVNSVTRDGVQTSYSRVVSGTTGTVTRTNALSQQTVILSDLTSGRPTSVTDALSRQTQFQYDSNARLTRVTRPEGNYTQITYDSRGNVTETRQVEKPGTSLPDIVATASFDATCANVLTCNRPNSVTDERDFTTTFTYDPNHGGVQTVTSPAPTSGATQPQTRYSYTQVTAATGQPVYMLTGVSACHTGSAPACVGTTNEVRSTIAYNTTNLLPTSSSSGDGTGALTATRAFGWDEIGNQITEDGPLAGTADTTRLRYDAARQTVGVVGPDPDGGSTLKHRAVRTTYRPDGQVSRVERGTVNSQSDSDWAAFEQLERVDMAFDTDARLIRWALTGSNNVEQEVVQTSYDDLGRPQCTALRMNPSTWNSLPASACTLATESPFYGPDRITRTTYDALNRPTLVQTGYGVTGVQADEATTSYTANGRVERVTDANNNRTTFEYDGLDRLVKTRFPVTTAGADQSSTTDFEQLTYETFASGTRTSNLVVTRTMRGGANINFGYDALGRLIAFDRPNQAYGEHDRSYAYDNLSRLTGVTTNSGLSLSRSHDALGRITAETGLHGTRSFAFDAAGRMTRLTWPDGFAIGYGYDVAGGMTEVRQNPQSENVLLVAFTYDDLGRRAQMSNGNATGTSYAYDPVSRPSQTVLNLNGTANDLTLDFAWNPASQLYSTTRSNDAFAYTGLANSSIAETVNGLNQVTNSGGSTVIHARGNLTEFGGQSFVYTSDNELAGANGTAFLSYDPLGRLLQIATAQNRHFDHAGDTIISEIDGNTGAILRRYVPGPDIDEPLLWYEGSGTGDRRWLHADERGSIVAVTDGGGSLVGSLNRYDEYGNLQGTLNGRFGYTGQPWLPEAGVYYYRARMYHPSLGRFMQTDPIGYEGGMNLYAYVGNDPVNRTDPSGLDEVYIPGATAWGYPLCLRSGVTCFDDNFGVDIASGLGGFGLIAGGDLAGASGGEAGGESVLFPRICRGPARILAGNTRFIGSRAGAYGPGTVISRGSAAVIARQFGSSTVPPDQRLRNVAASVFGWTDTSQYFIGLTDSIDDAEHLSGRNAGQRQDSAMRRDPGLLLVEIMGGKDEYTNINIVMPLNYPCPANTSPIGSSR